MGYKIRTRFMLVYKISLLWSILISILVLNMNIINVIEYFIIVLAIMIIVHFVNVILVINIFFGDILYNNSYD